jgi:hypothetical protein
MKQMKKATAILLAAALLALLCLPAAAMGYSYHAVSGVIYDDGTGVIERVEVVMGVENAAQPGGMDYVILAMDADSTVLDSYAFSVKFTGYPDGIGTVTEVPFTALIPYNADITRFLLQDASNQVLSEIELDSEIEVSDFTAVQNESSFSLTWSGSEGLTYDVTAYSQTTGQRDVLLYRSEDTGIEIPFEWVQPNDTIHFELAAHDGMGTVVLTSDSFDTPDGAALEIADADIEMEFPAEGEGDELTDNDTNAIVITIIIVGGVIVLAIIAAVVIIVLALKKKKNNNNS